MRKNKKRKLRKLTSLLVALLMVTTSSLSMAVYAADDVADIPGTLSVSNDSDLSGDTGSSNI